MRQKRNEAFYGFWSAAILLCAGMVMFAFLFVACSGGEGQKDPSPTPKQSAAVTKPSNPGADTPETDNPTEPPSPTPSEPPAPSSAVLAETEDMGQDYLDSIIFLGDSTTYGLGYYGGLGYDTVPAAQVWVPEGATFALFNQKGIEINYPETDEYILAEDAIARKKPEYMLIGLGVNGLAMLDEESFKNDYRDFVERLLSASPDTKIMLNSVYPVAREWGMTDGQTENKTGIDNDKINTANTWIIELAEEMGLRYLDSCSILKDDEGYLPSDWDNGDGMHLEGSTLEMVVQYIRTHGYQ